MNGRLITSTQGFDSNPDTRAPYQILWSPDGPGIYELYATVEDSDGNLMTSPVIRREAVLSKPPVVDFNPQDRAFGYVLPDSINDDGAIQLGQVQLISNGFGYHSYPDIEFVSEKGTGAEAISNFQDGQIKSVIISNGGANYDRYRRLTGTVKIGNAQDVLIGEGTKFMNELFINQPLLIGEVGSDEPLYEDVVFYLESFQSTNEIILHDGNGASINMLDLNLSQIQAILF